MAKDSNIIFFTCRKCGIEKPHDADFFVMRKVKGHQRPTTQCRDCNAATCREYNRKNKDRLREYERTVRKQTRHAGSDYYKSKWDNCDKQKVGEELRQWKLKNPDKARAIEVARNKRVKAQAKVDPEFSEKLKKKSRDWVRNKRRSCPIFREKALAATREWNSENKDWRREYGRIKRARNKDCPHARIMASVRARIGRAIKGAKKDKATSVLIGAPIEVVRAHIEAQFTDSMTWENWGRGWHGAREWHLDHIRPLASFDLTDPDHLAEACHYTNLQPLWSVDNLRKGDRYSTVSNRQPQGPIRP